MNDPIVEQITQNVLDTLANVTTDEGYNYTIHVEREKKTAPQTNHLNGTLYQLDPQPGEPQPNMLKAWVIPYAVELFIVIPEDEADTAFPSQIANRVVADMSKELMKDIYRGGLAYNTEITPWQGFTNLDNSVHGIQFNFEVTYRTLEVDPYTSA